MKRLEFGVNACFVRHGRVGGAEQATVNLLQGLRSEAATDERWVVYDREPLVTRGPLAPVRERTLRDVASVNRMVYEPVALSLRRQPSVWLHLSYVTPIGLRAPSVTVVHDLQYKYFPENVPTLKRAWLIRAHAMTARRAQAIVAISQFTARDLYRLHGSTVDGKVEVIPNAVSFDRLIAAAPEELPPHLVPRRPFLLAVAAHYRHKNLKTLIAAYELIAKRHEVDLVLVGQRLEQLSGHFRAPSIESEEARPGVRFTGFVPDAVLGALYRSASVFVFPSLFEGFGLPIVEALGLRVPTVTTRCGSIPEIGADHPLYVNDPRSPEELAEAVEAALDKPDIARPDEAAAEKLRAVYSPSAVAARYADLLRRVAGQ
ncbi:glycosyltransferase family 4 protein [Streptomyces sp. NPDC054833]